MGRRIRQSGRTGSPTCRDRRCSRVSRCRHVECGPGQALHDLLRAKLDADANRETVLRTAITATIWQLRVLAGWLPVGASGLARLFAAPMEITNIEAHLANLNGANQRGAISLGSLAVAWPRVARTTSPEQVRAALARSAWGDPTSADPASPTSEAKPNTFSSSPTSPYSWSPSLHRRASGPTRHRLNRSRETKRLGLSQTARHSFRPP